MRRRLAEAVRVATREVHKRRVAEWAESNEGPFPGLTRSGQEAVAELAVLCDALGALVAITPAQFDYAVELYEPPTGRPAPDMGWSDSEYLDLDDPFWPLDDGDGSD
jgi:hypothetical protein